MLSGIPDSVGYVQKSDDSRNSAIRIAYRNSLRPSSLAEPRHSSLKFSKITLHLLQMQQGNDTCGNKENVKENKRGR